MKSDSYRTVVWISPVALTQAPLFVSTTLTPPLITAVPIPQNQSATLLLSLLSSPISRTLSASPPPTQFQMECHALSIQTVSLKTAQMESVLLNSQKAPTASTHSNV